MCSALSFTLSLDSVRVEFVVLVINHFGGKFNTESDAFKMRVHSKWVVMHMKSIRGILYSVSFRDSISYACSLHFPSKPIWEESLPPRWMDSKCVPKWYMMHVNSIQGVCHSVYFTYMEFAVPVGIRFWGKFNTDSVGFNACQMRLGTHEVHSRCLALCFIAFLGFLRMLFAVLVVTHFGGKFNTGSNWFKTNAENS